MDLSYTSNRSPDTTLSYRYSSIRCLAIAQYSSFISKPIQYLCGRIVIRAKAEIEQEANHETIVVHEIPYGVNKAELIKYIADLVNEKKLDGIADINDESDYAGMRIVIKLKSDANANVVLNKLYKMTQMQASFSVTTWLS